MGLKAVRNDVVYLMWVLGISGRVSGALRASLRLVQRVTRLRYRRTVEPTRDGAGMSAQRQETVM